MMSKRKKHDDASYGFTHYFKDAADAAEGVRAISGADAKINSFKRNDDGTYTLCYQRGVNEKFEFAERC